MTSQINPQYRGYRFTKILVEGVFDDLELRRVAEDKLCEKLNEIPNCKGLRSIDVLFPGKQHTREEIVQVLSAHGIGAVLVLVPVNSGTTSVEVLSRSYTTGNAFQVGNMWMGSSTTTTTSKTANTPWANYKVALYSWAEDNVVWYATATTKGDFYAGWKNLIRSAAGKAVDQLAKAGLIGPSNSGR